LSGARRLIRPVVLDFPFATPIDPPLSAPDCYDTSV